MKVKKIILVTTLVILVVLGGCSNPTNSDNGNSIPQGLKVVIGRGYDITGSYAYSPEIKAAILDLNKLNSDGCIMHDVNLNSAYFQTVSGQTITGYQQSLAAKVSTSANAGIEGLGSFETEIGSSFSKASTSSDQYDFATSSTRIVKDAYVIDSGTDLTKYITQQFIDDVENLDPMAVIQKYGTHVMLGGVLGARLDYNMTAQRQATSTDVSIGAYANARANTTFAGVSAGSSTSASVDSQYSSNYVTSSLEITTKAFGGEAQLARSVQDQNSYDAWINSINKDNLIWSDYYPDPNNSLYPIYLLVGTNRWPADGDALRQSLFAAYNNYFIGKRINVTTSTQHSTFNYTTLGTVAQTARLVSGGDADIAAKSDSDTGWQLQGTITPVNYDNSTQAYTAVRFDYTYTVSEKKSNYTVLSFSNYAIIPLPGHQIVKLDGPTTETQSGTIHGATYNYVSVAGDGYTSDNPSGLMYNIQAKYDGSGNDTNNIGFTASLRINYTEKIN